MWIGWESAVVLKISQISTVPAVGVSVTGVIPELGLSGKGDQHP